MSVVIQGLLFLVLAGVFVAAIPAMWRIFNKAGRPGWAAIVPVYSTYVVLKIAGRPGWWLVLFFVPVVNIAIWVVVAIDLARRFGRGTMFAIFGFILWPIPFGFVLFSPIGSIILGFGPARYIEPDRVDRRPEPGMVDRRHVVDATLASAIAVAVAAASLAGWFGVGWLRAADDDSLAFSRTRDEVVRIGQAAIVTFHTLDYRKVDETLDSWQNASTGDLHNEVVGRRESSKQAIQAAKTVAKAELLKWSDGAEAITVTELNEREGKARVIAAVKATVTPEGKNPEEKRMRIMGELQRTETGDWKLSGIGQVQFAPAG